ncbi:MAG: hypothetical protein AB7V14_00605 [Kiritimatiellia bacterium]
MTTQKGSLVRMALGMALGWLIGAGGAWAQLPAGDLAKGADVSLRSAQSLFFNGKRDESVAALVQGYAQIQQLRQADAADARLAGLEARAAKLKTDLEKRLGKTIDLASGAVADKPATAASGASPLPARPVPPPAAAVSVASAGPAAGASAKLPYHAAQAMGEVDKKFRSVDGPYTRFDYYRGRGEYDSIVQALDGIDQSLAEIPALIEEARKLAAEKGVASHPDFDAADARIEREKARSAEARRTAGQQASASAAASGAVSADVDALASAYDRLREAIFDKATGGVIHYNDLVPVNELAAAIENFEQNEQAKAEAALADFAARYGATREAIDAQVSERGYSGNVRPGSLFEDFQEGIANVAQTRKAMGEDLLRRAREDLDGLAAAHDFFRAERRARVKEFAGLAVRFDPASAEVRQFVAAMPARFAEDDQAAQAKIDARKWPGSVSGKKAEEDAGLKFFREDPDWGARPADKESRIPVAVAITGDWTVQKTDILGQPVMYGVPALVAVEVPAEKAAQNVLRVYSVTLRTAESADARQAPPFREITVGDSFYIRPGAVK